MKKELLQIASKFFNTPIDSISASTPLKNLAKSPHDLILFSFEIEKNFSFEMEDGEVEKMKKLGDYLKLIKKRSPKTDEFNQAA